MNNEITYRIVNNQQVVELPLETLVKLEFILSSDSTKYYDLIHVLTDAIQEEKSIPVKIFNRIMERVSIIAEIDERIGYIDDSRQENKEFEKWIKEANDAKKDYKIRKKEYRKKANEKDFIDSVYNICKKEQDFYLIRDLSVAKEDLEKNLSYFCSKEEVRYLTVDFKRAYTNEDIEGMKKILILAQKKILKHWEDFLNNENKVFIGHSVRTYDIKGEFRSRYVSCSLFTEELLDTFHNRYGFKFSPQNIVSASSRDLYIDNYAEKDEDISFSIIKSLMPPERIIEECLKTIQQNKEENNERKKVYSEVVIKGFNPIGLFCLTNGSKELDNSYREVKKLQDNYPNLDIDYIDISTLIKGERLVELKKDLIKRIRERIVVEKNYSNSDLKYVYLDVTDDMVEDYDYFWTKFQELKKQEDYQVEDIMNIYKRNEELVSKMTIDNETITKLSREELTVLLKNNYYLRLKKIEEKNYSYSDLIKIANQLKNINNEKIDEVIPGLSRFISLFPKVPVSDKDLQEYLCHSNSFTEINEKLEKILLITKNDQLNILDKYNIEIEALKKDITNKKEIIAQIKHNKEIISMESLFSLVKLEEREKSEIQKTHLEELRNIKLELNEITEEENNNNTRKKVFSLFKRKSSKINYRKEFLIQRQKELKKEIENIEIELEKMKFDFLDKTKIEYLLFEDILKEAKIFNENNNLDITSIELIELELLLSEKEKEKDSINNKINEINEILGRKEEIDELKNEEEANKNNINYRHML